MSVMAIVWQLRNQVFRRAEFDAVLSYGCRRNRFVTIGKADR